MYHAQIIWPRIIIIIIITVVNITFLIGMFC